MNSVINKISNNTQDINHSVSMSDTMAAMTAPPSNPPSTRGEVIEYSTFDDMQLPEKLLRGIYAYGFEHPSKIQKLAIVPMRNHNDIIAQSQSGTGKTGSFAIGSLSCVDSSISSPQILVISPTRELAHQTHSVFGALSNFMGLKSLLATGGNHVRADIKTLHEGVHYVVGTPGRVYDLLKKGELSIHEIKYIILDEADQLLEDLFAEQIRYILKFNFPSETRMALFSATLSPNVVELSEKILIDPVRILINKDEVSLAGIKQFYVQLEREEWKYDVLMDLYQRLSINQAIIYVNTRKTAEILCSRLKENGYTIEYIHGEMDVHERKKKMQDFRAGSARILISTDLLARGIDVQQVSLIVNYDMPYQHENYIHRIGRCGRYGRRGLAINLLAKGSDVGMKEEIEKYYSIKIDELTDNIEGLSKFM